MYNIVGGLIAIAFYKVVFKIIYNISYNKQQHELLLQNHILLFGFVAIVGIGLIKASYDPRNNTTIILVSALGKLFAFLTWLISYYKGAGTMASVMGGAIDAIFAILFIKFIVKNEY